jgi:HAD superfamily hydrolase (TIGR01509 family)
MAIRSPGTERRGRIDRCSRRDQLPLIRALIFDFDGLILDTEGPEFQSWIEIYQYHGARLEFAVWAATIGTASTFDAYAELERQVGRPLDRAAIRAHRRQRNEELFAAEAVRPGVLDYVREARERGLGLAVASSSPRSWVGGHLERLGIINHFDHLRCADDVQLVKPDPELYLSAIDALGVAANEAIALEDSPNGILAAKRAGLYCVAVPNPLTRQLPLDLADLRVESLADLPLQRLLDAHEGVMNAETRRG